MNSVKILLLEDEPVIASDLKMMLEEGGYQVLHTGEASGLVSLCARHLPDFVILNYHQKDAEDGMYLARLLSIQFMTKILFVTGARKKDLSNSPDFYAGYEVLYKPFTRRQLHKALSDLLL